MKEIEKQFEEAEAAKLEYDICNKEVLMAQEMLDRAMRGYKLNYDNAKRRFDVAQLAFERAELKYRKTLNLLKD